MNITLFGCKDTTLHVAKFLSDLGIKIDLITISPKIAERNDIAGYFDLTSNKKIFNSIYQASNYSLNKKDDKDFFTENNTNLLGFCIGWQRLIPEYILDSYSIGVFGMHGSARDLPFGKGRSPMNWAILENRKWFHTNLFRYLAGVDNGPIVARYTFSIKDNDNAETLHYKNTLAMCFLIQKNLNGLLDGTIKTKQQKDNPRETYYPKRNPEDGKIDWKDDIFNIERLIRAVSPPFYGGFSFKDKTEIKIYRANVFYTDVENHPYLKDKFGKIVEVFPNGKFLVRCSGGVLIIHEYEGDSPEKGASFKNQKSSLSNFNRNDYGFFDVAE